MDARGTCTGPASVVFDPSLTSYDFGPQHPMAPVRVDLTMRLAHELGVLDHLRTVPAPVATEPTKMMLLESKSCGPLNTVAPKA